MFRPVNTAEWEVTVDHAPSGNIYVRPKALLGPYPIKLTDKLDYWAEHAPDRTFLAERDASGEWRSISYGNFRSRVRGVAQGLLDRGLNTQTPVAILSGNSIEHALVAYGAMYVGIPHAPLSPAYSTVSKDFARLKQICGVLRPSLLFAVGGSKFAPAIAAVLGGAMQVAHSTDELARPATPEVDAAAASITRDTIAKILFTSGSTGAPKGVITTQRMLCSNQEMLCTALPCLKSPPPVICDWLPWNHVFGGNHNFGLVLYNGGTMYLDEGKPTPGLFAKTLRNLREVATTVYFNVPKGYELLIPALRDDAAFRETFYSRLGMTFFAAAGLSQRVWDDFDEISIAHCGARIAMLTGLGATETSPFSLCVRKELSRSGAVGLPVPGVELKLAKVGEKWEARLRGDNILRGFWEQPELTRKAFDEEGFYCMGDALRWVDAADPQKGLLFDGRINEDFKLSTGTWVSVGPLRMSFILHCAPYVRDVVIAGANENDVTALVFADQDNPPPSLLETFKDLLESFSAKATGSSTRIARLILLQDPPSLDASEITDKGSINQKAVLRHREDLVKDLYTTPPPAHVICL